MVQSIFGTIGEVVTSLASTIKNALEGATSIFVNLNATSGQFESFTFIGTLLLIAVGGAVVYWAIRLIRGMVAGVGSKA